MNKILLLLICIIGICAATLTANSQQPKTAPQRPASVPVPRGPLPYVLKKDFEPQMQEINSKVNAALNSTGNLRKGISEKFGKIDELSTQMQKVEQILNSASFQIALTSDSLKETRFSVEEFRKGTDKNIQDLHAEDSVLMNYLLIGLGSAVLLTLILIVIVLVVMNSKIKKLKYTLQQQASTLADELHTHQKELKEEVQNIKSQLQGEIYSMKTVITGQVNREIESTTSQIKIIMDKLTEYENRNKPGEENDAENKEII